MVAKVTPFLLVAAALLLALTWNSYCDNPRVRQDAALEATTDSTNRAVASLLVANAEAKAREAALLDTIGRLKTRTPKLVNTRVYTDTVLVNSDAAVREAIAAERAVADSVIAVKDAQITIWAALYNSAANRADSLEKALVAQRALTASWQRKAQPGVLEQGRRALPWMALALLANEVTR
jgi:hypothetical protein